MQAYHQLHTQSLSLSRCHQLSSSCCRAPAGLLLLPDDELAFVPLNLIRCLSRVHVREIRAFAVRSKSTVMIYTSELAVISNAKRQ